MGLLETLPRKYITDLGGVSEVFIGYPRLVIGKKKEVMIMILFESLILFDSFKLGLLENA